MWADTNIIFWMSCQSIVSLVALARWVDESEWNKEKGRKEKRIERERKIDDLHCTDGRPTGFTQEFIRNIWMCGNSTPQRRSVSLMGNQFRMISFSGSASNPDAKNAHSWRMSRSSVHRYYSSCECQEICIPEFLRELDWTFDVSQDRWSAVVSYCSHHHFLSRYNIWGVEIVIGIWMALCTVLAIAVSQYFAFRHKICSSSPIYSCTSQQRKNARSSRKIWMKRPRQRSLWWEESWTNEIKSVHF